MSRIGAQHLDESVQYDNLKGSLAELSLWNREIFDFERGLMFQGITVVARAQGVYLLSYTPLFSKD